MLYQPSVTNWHRRSILALLFSLCLLLGSATGAFANTVHIYDNANVLNGSQVQSEAASLPYPVDIYTVNNFAGSNANFDQETASKVANNSQLIVIAIDTVHHHMAIKAGSNVPLTGSQADSAVAAFKNNYGNGDYTGATIALLRSLRSSLGAAPANPGSGNNPGPISPSPGSGLFSNAFGVLCCIALLVLLGVIGYGLLRRRNSFARPVDAPYQPPYQGYQGNYPPGYGPGYPPQGPGMNPWAAGGLGAAAGGLMGYELGRQAGEHEEQGRESGGDPGAGGDFGGGSSGDFGGGSSGDFGGDSSGDFGGGSSGNF